MEIDGGGWLFFQYRHNGEIDFQRNWQAYKEGFGSLDKEFWLGNDFLNSLTNWYDHEAYIHGEIFNGEINFSKYSEFKVDNEDQKYRLHVSGRTGLIAFQDGALFSTTDEDNDSFTNVECSNHGTERGGFWFTNCGVIYPNGFYYTTEPVKDRMGMQWYTWRGISESLKGFEMMVRRKQ